MSVSSGGVEAAASESVGVASGRRGRRRVALALSGALFVTVAVAAAFWWSTYEPVSTSLGFGGGGQGSAIIGLRTENTGHFEVRVTGVTNREAGPGIRLRSVRTRATPSAPAVPPFRPFTLKPGQQLYLVLDHAIECGQVRPGDALGGVDIHYETLGIGRTEHVTSVYETPELTPSQAACG